MNQIPSISEAEFQVMKIIWANHPISTNEVIEKVAKNSKWSPKTIQTLLARLVKKGVLDYQKNSRVFVYTPLVEEAAYLDHESKSFLNRFYSGTLNSMLVSFLEHKKLSDDEIHELKAILNKANSEEESQTESNLQPQSQSKAEYKIESNIALEE